jgi:mRNA interferase MazF
VIVGNNTSNRVLTCVQVIPLTSNTGRVYPSDALVAIGGRSHKAMANQIQTAAKQRLANRLGALSAADMWAVERAIKLQLALP